jgi:hypothetical protein
MSGGHENPVKNPSGTVQAALSARAWGLGRGTAQNRTNPGFCGQSIFSFLAGENLPVFREMLGQTRFDRCSTNLEARATSHEVRAAFDGPDLAVNLPESQLML